MISPNDSGVSVGLLSLTSFWLYWSQSHFWNSFICLTLLRVLNKLVSHYWPRNVLEA